VNLLFFSGVINVNIEETSDGFVALTGFPFDSDPNNDEQDKCSEDRIFHTDDVVQVGTMLICVSFQVYLCLQFCSTCLDYSSIVCWKMLLFLMHWLISSTKDVLKMWYYLTGIYLSKYKFYDIGFQTSFVLLPIVTQWPLSLTSVIHWQWMWLAWFPLVTNQGIAQTYLGPIQKRQESKKLKPTVLSIWNKTGF